MKLLALTTLILTAANPVFAHLGPDLTQADVTGQTPVRIAISQPASPTWPMVPIASCPLPMVETQQVACAN